MAKKFKKNGNVNFSGNANLNQAFNGNLQIQSPNFELLQSIIDHQTGVVSHSVIFYESIKTSNPAARIFTFSKVAQINAGTYDVNEMETDILSMNELSGAIEQ